MNEIEIELKLQIRVGSYLTALKEGGSVSGENYAEEITSMTRTLSDKATSAASNVVQALVTLKRQGKQSENTDSAVGLCAIRRYKRSL